MVLNGTCACMVGTSATISLIGVLCMCMGYSGIGEGLMLGGALPVMSALCACIWIQKPWEDAQVTPVLKV